MASTIPSPLSGRYCIITGGSRGIGAAIAADFARKGAKGIAITYTSNKAAADEVLGKLRAIGVAVCAAIKGDLLDPDFGKNVVQKALKEMQVAQIDVVVNNAAFADMKYAQPFEESTQDVFDMLMHGNVWAPSELIRAVIPYIATSGRIINISSVSARRPNIKQLMYYGASKAALESMTRSLALEYAAKKKITINSISVGPTNTDPVRTVLETMPAFAESLTQRASAEKRIGEPEDVANIVSFIASEESRWINGCLIPANGGSMLELQG